MKKFVWGGIALLSANLLTAEIFVFATFLLPWKKGYRDLAVGDQLVKKYSASRVVDAELAGGIDLITAPYKELYARRGGYIGFYCEDPYFIELSLFNKVNGELYVSDLENRIVIVDGTTSIVKEAGFHGGAVQIFAYTTPRETLEDVFA